MQIRRSNGNRGLRMKLARSLTRKAGGRRIAAGGRFRRFAHLETLEHRCVLAAVAFAETTVFEGGLSRSQAIATADIDGDGDLDAVAASANEAWVLFNDGTAQFSDPVIYPTGSGGDARSVMLTDLNGDSAPDLLIGSIAGETDSAVVLMINDGAGAFSDPIELVSGIEAGFVEAMDVGDIDGDGDIDLVVGDRGDTQQIYLLRNNGAGVFSDPDPLDFDNQTAPRGLVVVDFDGDNDQDVVVTSALEDAENPGTFLVNLVFWYRNNGSGEFQRSLETDTQASPRFLDVADFDGDGDQDIVVPQQGADEIALFVNDGTNAIDASILIDAEIDEVERTSLSTSTPTATSTSWRRSMPTESWAGTKTRTMSTAIFKSLVTRRLRPAASRSATMTVMATWT